VPREPVALRQADAYLTDGRRLFRVVRPLGCRHGPDVALVEDCRTLRVQAFTIHQLRGMRLIPVAPGG
jgi:hypothetical protein